MRSLFASAVIAAAVFTAAPAIAGPVNFGAVLTDQDGHAIKDSEGRLLTLGRASMMALMQNYPEDQNVGLDEKARRGTLALRVYTAGKEDLPAEDVALIKKYVGKLYPPLIVVRAMPLLEGKEAPAPVPSPAPDAKK